MFLKTALFGLVSLKDMETKYRHNLEKLWQRFKAKEADVALDHFNATIIALHEFENIRYPDMISAAAIVVTVTWEPSETVEAYGTASAQARKYEVPISDVDELVFEILRRIPLNPKSLTSTFSQSGRAVLRHRNAHAADWLDA
jgi:hypothetical protein